MNRALKLLLAFSILTTANVVRSQDEEAEVEVENEDALTFASKTTLPILGDEYHTSC